MTSDQKPGVGALAGILTAFLLVGCAESDPPAPTPRLLSERLVATVKLPGFTSPLHFYHPYNPNWSLVVSPDGRRVAYISEKVGGLEWAVVLDGVEQKKYRRIYEECYGFSPDSRHFAYLADVDGGMALVIDGKEQRPYDLIKDLEFSAGGTRPAYNARVAGGKFVVVDNDVEHPIAGKIISAPALSPDGSHIAYAVDDGRTQTLYTDHTPGPSHDSIAYYMTYSPDGRLAYSAGAGKPPASGKFPPQSYLVIGGVRQKTYGTVSLPTFSGDGKHFAYVAGVAGGVVAVVDGHEQKWADGWGNAPPRFSPDGSRIAYIARALPKSVQTGKQWMMVVDGQESLHDDVVDFAFSPDSRRSAYVARDGDSDYLVVDGNRGGPHHPHTAQFLKSVPPAIPAAVCFSPDSAHVVFWEPGRQGLASYLVFDDQRFAQRGVPIGPIVFEAPRRLRFLELRYKDSGTEEVYAVQEEIPETLASPIAQK